MAGAFYTNAAFQQQNWVDETTMINKLKKGFYNLEFTNMDNTSQPAIAAGSSVDIDGVIAHFDTEEAITGSPSDGTAYVKIYDNGGVPTAEFTNTVPTWDYGRSGYYDGSDRYVLFYKAKTLSSILRYQNKIYMDTKYWKQDNQYLVKLLSNTSVPNNPYDYYGISDINLITDVLCNRLMEIVAGAILPNGSNMTNPFSGNTISKGSATTWSPITTTPGDFYTKDLFQQKLRQLWQRFAALVNPAAIPNTAAITDVIVPTTVIMKSFSEIPTTTIDIFAFNTKEEIYNYCTNILLQNFELLDSWAGSVAILHPIDGSTVDGTTNYLPIK